MIDSLMEVFECGVKKHEFSFSNEQKDDFSNLRLTSSDSTTPLKWFINSKNIFTEELIIIEELIITPLYRITDYWRTDDIPLYWRADDN